ncbi:MAG: hypothetical protein R2710_23210 [Acidimicrobiales bacterium]
MRRTIDRRRAKAAASSLCGVLLVGTAATPAGAKGPSLPEGDGPTLSEPAPKVELDPTDFNPFTITDTEVSRMRSQLMSEQIQVGMIDRRAARLLAEAASDRSTARQDLRQRTDELAVLENTLGAAAIEGYLSDSASESVPLFGQYVESDATFADETATQLLERREEARQAVASATEALDRAERMHRIATARKRQAERSVEAALERQESFDELAAEQSQAAERADAEAAAASDDIELRSVAGTITVNAEIEHQIDRLIADARADGLDLAGGGYRTIEAQIALRISHCGGSSPAGVELPAEGATPEELALTTPLCRRISTT